MNSTFYVALGLLLVGLFTGRLLGERAHRHLSAEEKVTLLDSFSQMRVYGYLPLIAIVGIFLGAGHLPEDWISPAYYAAWVLLGLFFAATTLYVSRKMKRLGINAEFRRAHLRARCIAYGGFLAYFLIMGFAYHR